METWYSKELAAGLSAQEPLRVIMESFMAAFALAGAPTDMCIFSSHDLNRNVITVYFSPSASQVAQMYGAVPCEKLSRDRLGMLVGHGDCMRIHYPGTEGRQ
jgi:hypothetical protein